MRGWVLALALAACASPAPVPEVPPLPAPMRTWGLTRVRLADPDTGRIDWERVRQRRPQLEGFVAWLAEPRPPRVTRALGRHAFYLHAHDALVLWGALHLGLDAEVDASGLLTDAQYARIARVPFVVDGHPVTLHQLVHGVLRSRVQDHRDAAALHFLTASDPPGPDVVWEERDLDRQLDEAMIAWVNHPSRGVSAAPDGTVRIPPRMAAFHHDASFQTAGETPCTVAARYAHGDLRLALEAAEARGCRWEVAPVVTLADPAPAGAGG